MNARFRRTVKMVTAFHALALLTLAAGPCMTCKPKPPETAISVSFRMEAPSPPVRPDPTPMVPEPSPEPVVKPSPPKPTPPDPRPADPPPKPRRKIEVSQKRVVRDAATQPEPVFQDEFVRSLEKKLTHAKPRDSVDDNAVQLHRVRDTLYRAWENRPSAQEAAGAVATVTLRFEAGGRVLERSLTGPSGNAALDASVMQAVQTVTWIPGLSEEFLKSRNHRVSVAFRLE